MVYSSNTYLNKEQMTVNANYIFDYFINRGWTKNAIAGMLGNMERESTINPGLWQSLNQGNMSGGYGLVQWTPASNYINWANANGYNIGDILGQCERIIYELNNNLQYIATSEYPLSFTQFTQSLESPEYLASAFLKNYERAGVEAENDRRTFARYWFENLEGGVGLRKPHFPTTEGLSISSPYGWRTHPITHLPDFHAAIDISGNNVNHPIYATQTGIVIDKGFNSSLGYYIVIQHTLDPYFSRYIHLAELPSIAIGSNVNWGQEIATMGTTGSSTGIHLDFAIATKENGFNTEEFTIDPEIYLEMEFGGGEVGSDEDNLLYLLLSGAMRNWDM